MKNLNDQKLTILEEAGKIIKLIDDKTDWFLASLTEKDPKNRELARFMADKKSKELKNLLNEKYE